MMVLALVSAAWGATLSITGACGGPVAIDVSGLTPYGTYAILSADAPGGAVLGVGPCAGIAIGLDDSWVRRTLGTADSAGEVHISPLLPSPVACGAAVQVVDATTCDQTNVEVVAQLTLTSTAWAEGEEIPIQHSCYDLNISPELSWTDAPVGTQSFGVFLRDDSINFNHSAIFDIDLTFVGLPEDIEKLPMPAEVPGALQPRSYAGWFGYAGPCPNNAHTYDFTLYALDEPLLGLDQNANLALVRSTLAANALATATLTGTFTPPP